MLVQVAFFSEENTRKTGHPAAAAGGRPRPASAPAALAQIETPLYVPRPPSPSPPRPGRCPNLDFMLSSLHRGIQRAANPFRDGLLTRLGLRTIPPQLARRHAD